MRLVSSNQSRFGVAMIERNRSARHALSTALSNTSARLAQNTRWRQPCAAKKASCFAFQASGLRQLAALGRRRGAPGPQLTARPAPKRALRASASQCSQPGPVFWQPSQGLKVWCVHSMGEFSAMAGHPVWLALAAWHGLPPCAGGAAAVLRVVVGHPHQRRVAFHAAQEAPGFDVLRPVPERRPAMATPKNHAVEGVAAEPVEPAHLARAGAQLLVVPARQHERTRPRPRPRPRVIMQSPGGVAADEAVQIEPNAKSRADVVPLQVWVAVVADDSAR